MGTIVTQDGWEYRITTRDRIWAGRMAEHEGSRKAASLWCMTWYFARRKHRFRTFADALLAYSQPINPRWRRDGVFCRPGGEWHGTDYCSEVRLQRRDRAQQLSWGELSPETRRAVEKWMSGQLKNPVPRAMQFAAPGVARRWMERNPGSRVFRLDNWYIVPPETQSLPKDWVKVKGEGGALLLPLLLGGGLVAGAWWWKRRQARGARLRGVAQRLYGFRSMG